MPRYALLVEYDGLPFAGWQRQADQPSVQGALEAAIAHLDESVPGVAGAGRTDAGVHALGQVAHVDLSKAWDPSRLAAAINAHLRPAPVAVIDAAPVSSDFHARFSAVRRDYRYVVVARRAPLAIERGRAWRTPRYLDAEAMRSAAAHLIGCHDFTTFRSSMCQAKSPVKTLDQIDIETSEGTAGQVTTFALSARSFLHNQVRSIVGTLERVGVGAWSPERVGAALKAQDRATCGPVAPPDGLFLVAVSYPESPFED